MQNRSPKAVFQNIWVRRICYLAFALSPLNAHRRLCINAQDLAENFWYVRIYYLGSSWESMCPYDEGSNSTISAKTINGIHFSNYIYHIPPGDSSPILCSRGWAVTYGSAAVSDAAASAKTISDVCLSNEVQELALGRNQRKEEGSYTDDSQEDGLIYRKETALRGKE